MAVRSLTRRVEIGADFARPALNGICNDHLYFTRVDNFKERVCGGLYSQQQQDGRSFFELTSPDVQLAPDFNSAPGYSSANEKNTGLE
ncbi:unnamed protein product [Calypogeia fissa]